MRERDREHLRGIFAAAVGAVRPEALLGSALRLGDAGLQICEPDSGAVHAIRGPILVIGAGKAAAGMARALDEVCGTRIDLSGAVVAPVAERTATGRIAVLPGEHPIPGETGLRSTAIVVDTLRDSPAREVVCLLSGGASSLLVSPLAPVTLAEKQRVTDAILRCGADIGELNTVRKHLSAVKGGRLLAVAAPRRVTTLLISDVIGDDPATIGSGPTVPDRTSYGDAIEVLQRYALWHSCPEAVRHLLRRGASGAIAETVRPDTAVAGGSVAIVLGSNRRALEAAAREAGRRGFAVEIAAEPIAGDSTESARSWARSILADRRQGPRCWLAGGESTVVVRGNGLGGRNQEFALAMAQALAGSQVSVLSAGSDGIDGPTEAAGAFVDGDTGLRATQGGLDPATYLADNDSFHFFEGLGDLFVPGPTGTNVMDLKIAVRP